MAPSEQIATDEQVREVVRRMADAAPMAPDWSVVTARSAQEDDRGTDRMWQVTLVAAAVILLIGGLWWAQRPTATTPADVPTETLPVPSSPSTVPVVTLEALDPLDAQGCLTRRNARLVRAHGLLGLEGSEDLAGYTVDRARASAYWPIVSVWAALAGHPEVESAPILSELVSGYRVASDLEFAGTGGTEGEGYAEALSTFENGVGSYLAAADDPAVCHPATPADPSVDPEIARAEGRCVAAVRLGDVLARLASTTPPADDAVVSAAAAAVRDWYNRPPTEVLELAAAVDDVLAESTPTQGVARVRAAISASIDTDNKCVTAPSGPIGPLSEGGNP